MSAAARSLSYLAHRSIANRAAGGVRRLRDARYLAALIVGLAYLGWVFFGMARGDGRGTERARFLTGPGLEPIAALALFALATVWWAAGRYHRALAFTPAEVHFLFSAPLERPHLIRYKLLTRQVSVFVTVAFVVLNVWLFRGDGVGPGGILRVAGGAWLLVTTLQLHQVASSLVRTAAEQQGRVGLRRQGLPLMLFAGAAAALLMELRPALGAALASESFAEVRALLAAALAEPLPRALLLPFRWVLAPLFASDWSAWLAALPGALVVAALHYAWVMRSDAAFEEGAAEAGRVQAERRRAAKQGRRASHELAVRGHVPRPWFPLGPEGHPAVAIVWKNVTLLTRNLRRSTALRFAAVAIGGYAVLRSTTGDPREAATVCMSVAFMMSAVTAVAGSLWVRNDLRTDLQKIDLLRTYPLKGRDVVAAEVAASTFLLTLLQVLLLCTGAAFMVAGGVTEVPGWLIPAGLLAAPLVLAPLNALLLGAQNALAMLFPAWTRLGLERGGGIEQMGLSILTTLVNTLFLALVLIPPLTFGGGVAFRLFDAMGAWSVLPAVLGGYLFLLGEVAAFISLLGEEYDKLDPAEAGLLA